MRKRETGDETGAADDDDAGADLLRQVNRPRTSSISASSILFYADVISLLIVYLRAVVLVFVFFNEWG